MATTEVPVWGDELQDYIDISGNEDWINITNLLSWEFDDDENAYEPDYIDTRYKKKFVLESTATIEYEKDMYTNNTLDDFLMQNEDNVNLPVTILRYYSWDEDNYAKKADFYLNPSQLDKNSSGEPVKLTGTLTMADDGWTHGTYVDGVFTASVDG